MHLIYVIGIPGAGKTSAVNAAVDRLNIAPDVRTVPIPHVRYGDVWYLGKRREPMGGTDALSMSIQPQVVTWLSDMTQAHAERPRVLIGEGDRLANAKFFDAARACGHRVTIVNLDCPPPVARQRAAARGSDQNVAWWNGRVTKVANLVNSRRTLDLDATDPPELIAAHLHQLLTVATPAVDRGVHYLPGPEVTG